ncbi:MAG: hypothetical protein E1N59_3373, partial [Puniceicoccaceae bacterium 5H]
GRPIRPTTYAPSPSAGATRRRPNRFRPSARTNGMPPTDAIRAGASAYRRAPDGPPTPEGSHSVAGVSSAAKTPGCHPQDTAPGKGAIAQAAREPRTATTSHTPHEMPTAPLWHLFKVLPTEYTGPGGVARAGGLNHRLRYGKPSACAPDGPADPGCAMQPTDRPQSLAATASVHARTARRPRRGHIA